MARPAAKGKTLLGAALAAAALLLAAPQVFASRPASSFADLLAPRSAAPPPTGSTADLATAHEDRGFRVLDDQTSRELAEALTSEDRLEQPRPRDRSFPLFAPPPHPRQTVEAQNLASGLKTWTPSYNISRLRSFASISRQRAPFDHRARFYDPSTQTFLEPDPLGPIDSPNLYQAFSLDSFNVTDPFGESWWTAAQGYVAGVVEEADPAGLLPETEAVDAGARAGSRDAEDFDVGKQTGKWTLRAATIVKAGVQQAVKVGWKEASKALAKSQVKAQLQGVVTNVTARLSGEAAEQVALQMGASEETADLVGGLTREVTSRITGSVGSHLANRQAPKGSAHPNTRAASSRGSSLHADKPGHLPDKLRGRLAETDLEFTPSGKKGQDVRVAGGKHPSEYEGSTWPAGVNFGDFKPNTKGGKRTFARDQRTKWAEPTHMLPYDPNSGELE